MWLSFVVILIGAELDAGMENQTVRGTTTGAPEPLDSSRAQVPEGSWSS
jgi:membrane protein